MTPEPPPHPARRNRPDPAFRRRALGLPDAPGASPASPPRESFRSALSRIPDLDRSGAEPGRGGTADLSAVATIDGPEPSPAAGPPVAAGPAAAGSGTTIGDASPEPADLDPQIADVDLADVDLGASDLPVGRSRRTSAPPPAPRWRRVAFAVVLVALVGTIPVLGRTGYRIITDSTDGRLARGGAEPGEPGYEELVTPSPTALVIHKDATTGMPVNLTFLSLAGDGGGTVIFVPLDTALARPGFGFDRLRTAYSIVVDADVPDDQADGVLGQQTGAVLNVGIGQVIVLDDAGWERSVAPVAPLDLDNPDPLDLGGTELLTGPIQVDAGLVGPYLRAAREGEDDANRFFRQEQLWRAWLASVASSTRADAVPGESTAGIGLFARRMALGPVTYATLPGTFGSGPSPLYVPDANEVNALIADAVPAPTAAYPGSRVPVRVLNGVAAADIPTEITKLVVGFGGSVDVVGNGPAFDSARTDIVYGDPAQKAFADLLRAGLGATGEVRQDPATPDNIGVTVILGKDLLGDEVATTTPGGGSGARNFTSSTTTTAIGGP